MHSPQQNQQQPSLQWRSPSPQQDAGHDPFFHILDLDVDGPSASSSPVVSGSTTPVLQATSALGPLSISQTNPCPLATSPSPSASSGATTPTPGLSQRRRAPAPGTIDLSFLGPRRPSLPSIVCPLESQTSSPRRVSLPENAHPILTATCKATPPARPPRDFPTPAILPNIVTPAAGWFGSQIIYGSGSRPHYLSAAVSSPLAPEMPAPGAPKVGCGLEGSASPCTFSPLPRTPVSSALPKTGYFAIAARAPKSASGLTGTGVSSFPSLDRPAPDLKLLGVGRPKVIRSRFSSVETPGICLGQIQESLTDNDIPPEDEKRERDDEATNAVEIEPRNGDGWAQADAARKRVLLEWETKRNVISPSSSSPNQPCGTPSNNAEAMNSFSSSSRSSLHHKVFGIPAPSMSPSTVFVSSPLASQTVLAPKLENEEKDDAGTDENTPSSSPPMLRSSSWTAHTNTTVSPWRRSAGKRNTLTAARSKPLCVGNRANIDITGGEGNVDVSQSGLQSGLFAPTAVIGSPHFGASTPSVFRRPCPSPMNPARSMSISTAGMQDSTEKDDQEIGLVLNFIEGEKPSVRRSKSTTEVTRDLPDLPQHGPSRKGKFTPNKRRGSSSSIQRSFVAVYTPPPLIPFPSPVGACRQTTGDESNTRVNPYFPLVV